MSVLSVSGYPRNVRARRARAALSPVGERRQAIRGRARSWLTGPDRFSPADVAGTTCADATGQDTGAVAMRVAGGFDHAGGREGQQFRASAAGR
ncbi:MAG: hypothetical protein M3Y33_02365 [Actinomycetota bacterium]|nr:hypothetical protein [Actinomycetota bacterium]